LTSASKNNFKKYIMTTMFVELQYNSVSTHLQRAIDAIDSMERRQFLTPIGSMYSFGSSGSWPAADISYMVASTSERDSPTSNLEVGGILGLSGMKRSRSEDSSDIVIKGDRCSGVLLSPGSCVLKSETSHS
jgi:hypothetical protein